MYQIILPSKKQLEIKYGNEQVFVVPLAETMHIDNKFTAIDKDLNCDTDLLLLQQWDSKGKFILRSDAEYSPVFQQLIPYALILNPSKTKFYVSRRIAGEHRLKDTFSLGFGGHINLIDGIQNVVLNSLNREINEELFIVRKKNPIKFLGYVRDFNSLTKEHLGFVFIITVKSAKIKETHSLKGAWMSLQDLIDNYYKFESWARYIIDYLFVIHQKNLPKIG